MKNEKGPFSKDNIGLVSHRLGKKTYIVYLGEL